MYKYNVLCMYSVHQGLPKHAKSCSHFYRILPITADINRFKHGINYVYLLIFLNSLEITISRTHFTLAP